MNPAFWDGYVPGEPNEKIRYWVDLWEFLIENLNAPFPLAGLELMNPHLLVRSIADEIIFHDFRNVENRAFFQQQLSRFLKQDPAAKKHFANDLTLIRRACDGTRLSYLLQLCRAVDHQFSLPTYPNALFDALRRIFDQPAWQDGDADDIRLISQCLIVELWLKGYSLETIKDLPSRIFDRQRAFDFRNHFADTVKESDFMVDGQFDFQAHHDAIRQAFISLSTADKLSLFTAYLSPVGQTEILLYQLKGIKGDNLDITVGNVNLYSTKAKRYLTSAPPGNEKLLDEEFFGAANSSSINAAVTLFVIDANEAEIEAIAAIERAFGLFRPFLQTDAPFTAVPNKYIRVSPAGEYWGSMERGGSSSDPVYRYLRGVDLGQHAKDNFDPAFLQSAAQLVSTSRGNRRIENSLHWFSKATNAETVEERLLAYWIVLENVIVVDKSQSNVLLPIKMKETKFALIHELLPCLEVCIYLQFAAGRLYQYLLKLMGTRTNGRPHLILPASIAEKASLNVGEGPHTIDLPAFVANLEGVADSISRKQLKDVVLHVYRLHNDIQFARGEIERVVRSVEDDLLTLYRLRNRIVHNAHYDSKVLPCYVDKVRQFAGDLIRQVVMDVSTGREATVENCLMRYYVKVKLIQERLSKGMKIDFLSFNF